MRRRAGTRSPPGRSSPSYLQGHDPRDPLASPIYANLQGLPPILIQVAENEALYSDSVRLADAARRHGVTVSLDTYADSVHVFPLFDFLPETEVALERVSRFVEDVVART